MKALRRHVPLLLLILWLPGMAVASALQAGAPAPAFSLPDADGKMRQLADWRGQWLVLYFYPRDHTPGCSTEAGHFRDALPRFTALKVQVAGVSLDDSASHRHFADDLRLPFALLADTDGKVAQSYGALLNLGIIKYAKRHTILIDPDGRVAKIYREVDPKTHATQLLADIKDFQRDWLR